MEKSSAHRETRRYHRKSRHGCAQCKQRHIKCDEKKPRCGNCVQSQRTCSFLSLTPVVPMEHRDQAPSRHTAARTEYPIIAPSPVFRLLDLSMLHHFTVHTSQSLSTRPEVQKTWGTVVVRLSFSHQYLLHGILAVAALHAAFTGGVEEDPRQLLNYAAEHQAISLSSYQSAIASSASSQCDALFALSILIFISAIALMCDDYNMSDPTALDTKWIRLARGIQTVAFAHAESIRNGVMAPVLDGHIFDDYVEHSSRANSTNGPEHLRRLDALWTTERSSDLEENEAAIYTQTLNLLRGAYSLLRCHLGWDPSSNFPLTGSMDADRAVIFLWILHISDEYVELLERHRPVALIILAHYASLLARCNGAWWFVGSAPIIIKRVQSILSAEYHKWIEEPLTFIQRK
ncbi:hypothetical protein VTN49DRAFT_1859 [Thermomyces lanuginosus]|uniref:uncharacterized protein n=1 Tax=Thermomyces lanuginosus TaxID=5541 RepID=UPI00374369F9